MVWLGGLPRGLNRQVLLRTLAASGLRALDARLLHHSHASGQSSAALLLVGEYRDVVVRRLAELGWLARSYRRQQPETAQIPYPPDLPPWDWG